MMKRMSSRLALAIVCGFWLATGISCHHESQSQPSQAAGAAAPMAKASPATRPTASAQTQPTLAQAYDLREQALKSVQKGDFDDARTLLDRAAAISQDPALQRLDDLIRDFQAHSRTMAQDRHKLFDQAVADIHILLDHKNSYAIDSAKEAYVQADDKDAFRHEAWVDALIKDSATRGDEYDQQGLWLRALRVYSDLGVLEPTNPLWRDKLKLTARRVRLLMIYTPDQLKKLQATERKERDEADKLLEAATRPSLAQANAPGSAAPTEVPIIKSGLLPGANVGKFVNAPPGVATSRPSTRPSDVDASTTQPDLADQAGVEDANIDWHEVTKGIQADMLFDALELAQSQYYRDVTYQALMGGGLTGLKTLLTTKGMEDTFPGLNDEAKKAELLHAIDSAQNALNTDKVKTESQDDAKDLLFKSLDDLMRVNELTVNLPEGVFVSEFADGAFSVLDPFSTVIWPYDLAEFEKTTQGDFGGVGIQIQENKNHDLMVVEPLPETPAERAGIQPDDLITRINGKSTKKITIDQAVRTITGVPGTKVTLTIRDPAGSEKDFILQREIIKVGSIKGYMPLPTGRWDYFIDPQSRIAEIRLTNFTKTTSEDLDATLQALKARGARGIILDLRNNPGGLLQAATEVVNKFVSGGVIVKTHADRTPSVNPPTEADARPEDMETDLPLVILVNPLSASASEIVSGALKDKGRAMLVGERTFGKGSVQMLFPLDSKEAYLKLTTSHYYLPSGRCIHREEDSQTWGVDPDVPVVMTPDEDLAMDDMRRDLDIRRRPGAHPATTQPTPGELLAIDPQLSAALLMLRIELSAPDSASAAAER
jgi:carboxyl-terminal processing protease